jgi:hypothetical protein
LQKQINHKVQKGHNILKIITNTIKLKQMKLKMKMGAPSKHKIYTEFYQTEAKNYKKHLDILGLNPETTQARYLYLKEFFSWLESNKIFELQEITPKEIALLQRLFKSQN